MPAQEGQGRNGLAFFRREGLGPPLENVCRLTRCESTRALRRVIIGFEQQIDIDQPPDELLSLGEKLHRFVKPFRTIEDLSQLIAAGIADVWVSWVGLNQLA